MVVSRRFRLLTWNVDGLDARNIAERGIGAGSIIQQHRPDVVLLQELVDQHETNLVKKLCSGGYNVHHARSLHTARSSAGPGPANYYNGIGAWVAGGVSLSEPSLRMFPTSSMGRHIVEATVHAGPWTGLVMSGHLESLGGQLQRAERCRQVRELWTRMVAALPHHHFVMFGGDTNLRDHELPGPGQPWQADPGTSASAPTMASDDGWDAAGLPDHPSPGHVQQTWPDGMSDVWEAAGRPHAAQFTWDSASNGNIELDGKPRKRFDRVWYMLNPEALGGGGGRLLSMRPIDVRLVGTDRLHASYGAGEPGLHPSDHYGLLVDFLMEGVEG